jgi:hypothetical protein
VESVLEKTYTLTVRVVNCKNEPVKKLNVTVSKSEKEPITLKQWGENLKNGTPFQRLVLSTSTDDNGNVTAEFPEGMYEVKVEKYCLSKACDLKRNDEVVFAEPKKRWWQ